MNPLRIALLVALALAVLAQDQPTHTEKVSQNGTTIVVNTFLNNTNTDINNNNNNNNNGNPTANAGQVSIAGARTGTYNLGNKYGGVSDPGTVGGSNTPSESHLCAPL